MERPAASVATILNISKNPAVLDYFNVGSSNQFAHQDPTTLFQLGRKFAAGDGVTQSDEEAFRCYRIAVEGGHTKAAIYLGEAYLKGKGVTADMDAALQAFLIAADDDDLTIKGLALNNIGMLYLTGSTKAGRDIVKAEEYFRKAVDVGFSAACSNMAYLYDAGMMGKSERHQAFGWYERCIQMGGIEAYVNLATCYEIGDGVEQDFSEAMRLYKLGADAGMGRCHPRIAAMYARGAGVEPNLQTALEWCAVSAKLDGPDMYCMGAADTLAATSRDATGPVFQNAYAMFKAGIEQGSIDCYFGIAYMCTAKLFGLDSRSALVWQMQGMKMKGYTFDPNKSEIYLEQLADVYSELSHKYQIFEHAV